MSNGHTEFTDVSTEEASTNFFWILKQGEESFNLQSTIRGCPNDDGLRAHFSSVRLALNKIVNAGGRAKAVGREVAGGNGASTTGTSTNGHGPEWTTRRGKNILILRGDASEPNEIDCPVHPGQKYKRRTNERGSWLSHKQGDDYCSGGFERA